MSYEFVTHNSQFITVFVLSFIATLRNITVILPVLVFLAKDNTTESKKCGSRLNAQVVLLE